MTVQEEREETWLDRMERKGLEAIAEFERRIVAGMVNQYALSEDRAIMATVATNIIDNNFTYHAPKPGQPEKYEAIRAKAKELAYLLESLCPNSRERSLAMTQLEESVFWANASIARNE